MTVGNELKVKEAIKRVCKMEKESGYIDEKLMDDKCDLKEELGFDSLLFVELVVEIEETLDFEFDMNDMNINQLRCFGELKKLISKYIDKR